jgi:hypothetical protein
MLLLLLLLCNPGCKPALGATQLIIDTDTN